MSRWLVMLIVAISALLPAQAQNQPRFRSGVAVTSIDVTIVDDKGRAISDLKPGDFTVLVDGEPRRVVSAEWLSRTAAPTRRSPAPSEPAGNGSSRLAVGGRLILIVIDHPNIRFGGAVGHRASINGFIDRLQPSDRVSVVNLGIGLESLPFTTDRKRAKEIVSKSIGGVPHPPSEKTPGEQTFDAIRDLMGGLQAIDGHKTLVLISQGLTFNAHVRPSFDEVERVAARARTTIYALRLDERVSNIGQKTPDARLGPTLTDPPATTRQGGRSQQLPDVPFAAGPARDAGPQGMEGGAGLYTLASGTGGAVFPVVMTADSALARVESELAGSYLLAVESKAADGDERPQSLRINVGQPGVTVRAARYLAGRVRGSPPNRAR